MMWPEPKDIRVIGPNEAGVFAWPTTSMMGEGAWYHGDDAGTLDCPHSKSGLWPVWFLTPDQLDKTPAEGNVWGIFRYNGVWYARTLHYLRPAQTRKLFPRVEWSTDKVNWPIPASWPGPERGESLGMFVSTRARYGTSQTQERSDIVWLRYGIPGIVAREGDVGPEHPEPDEPDTPVPPDVPCAPLPSQDDEAAWRERIEVKLDSILASIGSTQTTLVTATTTVANGLRDEFQRGVKIRWR